MSESDLKVALDKAIDLALEFDEDFNIYKTDILAEYLLRVLNDKTQTS